MSDEKFKATYFADDGYLTGDRPLKFHITQDDISDSMNETYMRQLFQDMMQENFEQRVSPTSSDEDKFVAWAKNVLAERATGEPSNSTGGQNHE